MPPSIDQTAFGCVITRNRLAWARTLVHSIRSFHPDAQCFVLLVDDVEHCFKASEEQFEVVELSDLSVGQLAALRFKYTPFELCCAVKPLLLRHLLAERGFRRAVYFDVDILVLSSVERLVQRFEHSDVLLTPHIHSDLPSDGKRPDDALVMKSGIFNAGFIGVRHSDHGLAFLDWWWGKCRDNCVMDHYNGFFVDQKYLDLAVGMFHDIDIVDDPGANVACWNLHERRITHRDGAWYSNDQPILFFHFSDYRLDRPDVISGHQDRFSFDSLPELRPLFDSFRDQVLANGEHECRNWPYGFGTYRNGRRIADRTRRAFRLAPGSKRPADPFDSSTHPLSLRLRSLGQGVIWVFLKLVDRFVARRQIRFDSRD